MIAGKIAGEVAEGLAKKAAPAVAKAAKKVATSVDDWGWKGGKPGEVSATEALARPEGYSTLARKAQSVEERKAVDAPLNKAKRQLEKYSKKNPESPIAKEYTDMKSRVSRTAATRTTLRYHFLPLEQADMPRKWTGKVANTLQSMSPERKVYVFGTYSTDNVASAVSKAMRPLTNEQRDTFVKLLPDWEGSLDDLVTAAKNL
jgi:hypothetical protein